MIVIGFDQAPTAIGYCYGEPGSPRPHWATHRPPEYGENTARLGKHVREWATQLIKSTGASRIYFEQIIVRKVGLHLPTLHKQFRVAGSIEVAAEMLGLEDDCFEIDVADWRREFYAGSRPTRGQPSESAAWKELALKECLRRNWLVDDHNAAEACGIWFYGTLHSDPSLRRAHKFEVRRRESAAPGAA